MNKKFAVLVLIVAAFAISAGRAGASVIFQNIQDHNFDARAAIKIQVLPEPATWSFIGLGTVVLFGLKKLRPFIAQRGRACLGR